MKNNIQAGLLKHQLNIEQSNTNLEKSRELWYLSRIEFHQKWHDDNTAVKLADAEFAELVKK
jgi:hypothetical protein